MSGFIGVILEAICFASIFVEVEDATIYFRWEDKIAMSLTYDWISKTVTGLEFLNCRKEGQKLLLEGSLLGRFYLKSKNR